MKNIISIIIVNYKSTNKTLNFIKDIPNKYEIIIVDNSNNGELSKKIKRKKKIKIINIKNNGYGNAINEGRKKINTKYFFAFSPDLKGVNKNFFIKFENAIKSKLEFGVIGPRFLKVTEKSHNQSNIKYKIGKIHAIAGSAMLFNTKAFDAIGGFDNKIFLFFEENDLCLRLTKKNYKIYQLNNAKVYHPKGLKKGVVKVNKNDEYEKLKNFYGYHYMWSKFYHFKKNKLSYLAYLFFLPIILKMILRVLCYIIINSKVKKRKYLMRLNGLISSMLSQPSSKRLDLNS